MGMAEFFRKLFLIRKLLLIVLTVHKIYRCKPLKISNCYNNANADTNQCVILQLDPSKNI